MTTYATLQTDVARDLRDPGYVTFSSQAVQDFINEALAANPRSVELKAVETWDGKLPQVTGAGGAPFINLREPPR
jgi:hypothetical protein